MKKHQSDAMATYGPQRFKTFEGALYSFFENECPGVKGGRVIRMLVQCVSSMVSKFFPDTSHLKQGQTIWPTVHKDAKGCYGKKIQDTKIVPVVLDLVLPGDAAARANGAKLRDMKKEAVARLCLQSYKQGGCLTNAELSILLKISPNTVSKYISEWEAEHETVLPRRGTIHDMGPSLTHKKIIIHKLFAENKSVQQTARETFHSPEAIQRYISTFRQTFLCLKKGMPLEEIAYVTGKTLRLIKEYKHIIDSYKNQSYILQTILDPDAVYIENNIELFANQYGGQY